jgi:hypothetical protein
MKSQKNVTTYKKPINWREFLKLNINIISDFAIFNKWFLLQNLIITHIFFFISFFLLFLVLNA